MQTAWPRGRTQIRRTALQAIRAAATLPWAQPTGNGQSGTAFRDLENGRREICARKSGTARHGIRHEHVKTDAEPINRPLSIGVTPLFNLA